MKVARVGSLLAVGLLGLGLSACSSEGDRETRQAPTDPSELGTIVTDVSLEELQQKTSFKYRVVNKKHNIYDVDASEAEILAAIPTAKVEPNRMDNKLIQPTEFANYRSEEKEVKEFVDQCSRAEKIRVLVRNEKKNQKRDKFTSFTVGEMGETLTLEGLRIDENNEESNEYLWVLSYAGLAKYQQHLYKGKKVDLPLKGVGQYKLTLVVKTDKNICGASSYTHLVTSNAPFVESSESSPSVDLNDFLHLKGANVGENSVLQDKTTIVAVIDSGVNYNHPSLNSKMLINEDEVPNNGVDDDGNGFVDDYVGYDFFENDSSPMDDVGHGSHVAGLVGGEEFGTSQNVKILAIKVGSIVGVDSASVAAAIFYAVDRGAKVINLSLGGVTPPTQIETDAYNYARDNGVLVVIAAGNGDSTGRGLNIDFTPNYPASINLDNMITVAASSMTSQPLTSYSNYGQSVDIAAPGGDFFSPLISAASVNDEGVEFVPMSGTSMAAPVVAGAAGELLSINSELNPVELKNLLVTSGKADEKLTGLLKNNKHLDLTSAVNQLTQRQLAFAN